MPTHSPTRAYNYREHKEFCPVGYRFDGLTCHKCHHGTTSNGGLSPKCHKFHVGWKQCSHVTCKLSTEKMLCTTHASHNPRLDTAHKKKIAMGKCNKKASANTQRIVIFHHGFEHSGSKHHCRMVKGKCSCQCRHVSIPNVPKPDPTRWYQFHGYNKKCLNIKEGSWNKAIHDKKNGFAMLVTTRMTTCNHYCGNMNGKCIRGQDNDGDSCNLKKAVAKVANNGCDLRLHNQVCVCQETKGPTSTSSPTAFPTMAPTNAPTNPPTKKVGGVIKWHGWSESSNPNHNNLPLCHGDCDHDSHCAAGLKCYHDQKTIKGCTGKVLSHGQDYCGLK